MFRAIVRVVLVVLMNAGLLSQAEERQLTFSPKNHDLDGTHNFSGDGRCLCYDTRGMAEPGIENCQSIEKVDVVTGKETVLYQVPESVTGQEAAPGVGAPYFSESENKVAFIHGPLLSEVKDRGYYAKDNRNGVEVMADGSGSLAWLDKRDVETSRDTIPGAHRGGTHDHEYARQGNRIGFTYDDALLHQYDRTIGYMEKHSKAPEGASHYFCLLVSVVPKGSAKPGEIEKAWGDNWVDARGTRRAFIGKVRAENGVDYEQSLFVVDIPEDVDITTADSGSATRFPRPPQGIVVRRLTHSFADGIVHGSYDGKRIAYYGLDEKGRKQVFVIPADGSDRAADPSKHPVQVTSFTNGVDGGLRWHPRGDAIACIADGGVAVVGVKPGPKYGDVVFLTPRNDGQERFNLVWSPDGSLLAFNKRVPTKDENGKQVTSYDGRDLLQIFLVNYKDVFQW